MNARPSRRALALLAALLVAAGSMFVQACGDDSDPPKLPAPGAVATAESASRPATFAAPISTTPESGDGDETPIALDARIFGSGPTGVILAHQRPADQTSWFPFAAQLAATGNYTVLTFNFRGFGESTGEKAFDRIDTDLMAAYVYMRDTLRITRIFLIGASIGGTASLVVAARVPVAGVVSISAPAQFESLNAVETIGQIRGPKLFISSQRDVPAERSQRELFDAATEPKDQQLYQGDAHGTDLFAGPYGPELERRLLDFLSRP